MHEQTNKSNTMKVLLLILLCAVNNYAASLNSSQVNNECEMCTSKNNIFIKALYFGHFLSYAEFKCKTSLDEISRYAIICDIACKSSDCKNFFNR